MIYACEMDLCCFTCARRAKKPGLATGLCFYSVIRNPSGNIPNCGSSGRKRRSAPERDGSHVAMEESCGRITRSPQRISASVCRKSLTPIGKSSRRQSVCGSSSDRTNHQSCAAIGPPSTVSVNQNTEPPATRSRILIVHWTASRPRCSGSSDG